MSTSIGGGYCDCGDVEAWKDFAHCSIHMPGSDAGVQDPLTNVPLDIQRRARIVFSSVLKYAYELLTLDTFMKLPGDLQYKEGDTVDLMDDLLEVENLYATVLYNDEASVTSPSPPTRRIILVILLRFTPLTTSSPLCRKPSTTATGTWPSTS